MAQTAFDPHLALALKARYGNSVNLADLAKAMQAAQTAQRLALIDQADEGAQTGLPGATGQTGDLTARGAALPNGAGPVGQTTVQGGPAGGLSDTFNGASDTKGLPAGTVARDANGVQWLVGQDGRWTPYTGQEQLRTIEDDYTARNRLVQDWYDGGMDAGNTEAAAAEQYLYANGRLNARKPDPEGYVPLNVYTLNEKRGELGLPGLTDQQIGESGVNWAGKNEGKSFAEAAADYRAANPDYFRGTGSSAGTGTGGGTGTGIGTGTGAGTGNRTGTGAGTGNGTGGVASADQTPHQKYLASLGEATEPWTGTAPEVKPFEYGERPAGWTEAPPSQSAFEYGERPAGWTEAPPSQSAFEYGEAPAYQGSRNDNKRLELLNRLENSSFRYDQDTDPAWQALQKQYRREGQRATEDVLGRVSGLTGGKPSSYAVTAAAQAGNRYAAELSDRLPELYQSAYSRYLQDYERQLGLAEEYGRLGQEEYDRYRDSLSQYNRDRDFAYGVYSDQAARERQNYLDRYNQWADGQDRYTQDRSFAYDVYADQAARDRQNYLDRYNQWADGQDLYDRDRNFAYDVYSDQAARERQAYLDRYGEWADEQDRREGERSFAYGAEADQYDRTVDEEERAWERQQLLRQYDDQQRQQEWENAFAVAKALGYVPDWAAELLGVPAGTPADRVSGRNGGSGGGSGVSGSGGQERNGTTRQDLVNAASTGAPFAVAEWAQGMSDRRSGLTYVGTHPNGLKMTSGYQVQLRSLQEAIRQGAGAEAVLRRVRELVVDDIIEPYEANLMLADLGYSYGSAGTGRNTVGTGSVQMVQ